MKRQPVIGDHKGESRKATKHNHRLQLYELKHTPRSAAESQVRRGGAATPNPATKKRIKNDHLAHGHRSARD